jgi:hypothetical protein
LVVKKELSMDAADKVPAGGLATMVGLAVVAIWHDLSQAPLIDADQAVRATASQEWNCRIERIRTRNIDLKAGTAEAGGCGREDTFVRQRLGNWERSVGSHSSG